VNNNPQIFTVDAMAQGERIDVYLAKVLSDVSRTKICKFIDAGTVLLNGSPASAASRLKSGDRVEMTGVAVIAETHGIPAAQEMALSFLYEDEYLVAIDKPAGMVVHPGNGVHDGTLVNALLFHRPSLSSGSAADRPGIIHRLDKETSGVLLAAKTDLAHRTFSAMFANREIKKKYSGICMGIRPPDSGRIEAAVGRSRRCRVKQSVRADGRSAVTEYMLLAHKCGISILELMPQTGRTHQLRLHCRFAGFPIICDSVYGTDREDVLKLPPLQRPFAYSVLKCFSRHALHAKKVTFTHPFTQKHTEIVSPFPADFQKAMKVFDLLSVVDDHAC
jgi:23S rRNA pseudouridine1911/1915/1917 synthase